MTWPEAFFYKDFGDSRQKIVSGGLKYYEDDNPNIAVLQAAYEAKEKP